MEEDLLNTSVDSWNGDEDVNKMIDINALVAEKEIIEGKHGQKYILIDTKTQQKYFAKSLDPTFNAEQRKNQKLETACCSAMLSCFSHTPYPVGIKNINNEDFIVFRCDEEYDTKQNRQRHNDLNYINETWKSDWNNQELHIENFVSNFNSLPLYGKNYFIQVITHLCFFGLKDRISNNMLFEKNGMHHIDIDDNNEFMFDTASINNLISLYGSYINILVNVNDQYIIEPCNQYLNHTINKILNIDYGKFADRFIRNCIVLGIKEADAYTYYKAFITKMKDYVQNTILRIQQSIDKHQKHGDRKPTWHEFFNSLLQGLQQMEKIINNNVNKITISQEDFKNQFKSKQDELNKNQPNTSNNNICNDCADKSLLQGLKQMKDNINNNVDEIPLNDIDKITISQEDFENQSKSKQDKLNNNQLKISNDNICNDCADKCLSIFRNCCGL